MFEDGPGAAAPAARRLPALKGEGAHTSEHSSFTLPREEQAMRVDEIMTRSVECVSPEDTIQAAARKMRDLDVGPMPVCGDAGRLVGMVTDRDIAVRAVAEGL